MSECTHRPRKNILWIFGDQHRSQALSCHGDPNVNTPNLDRLAGEGIDCRGALSGFPLCYPARGTLLTGRYAHQAVAGHGYPLSSDLPTAAYAFNDLGYHTAYFGKWHLDGLETRTAPATFHIVPPERRGGFQQWVAYEDHNSSWDCWVHGGTGDNEFHYRLPGYETDALTDLLIDYLKERHRLLAAGTGQPFFAILSVKPPHYPYHAPAEWMERHNPQQLQLRPNVPPVAWVEDRARRELAGYAGMIENLDWNLGRIRQVLDDTNLTSDTLIIFFSDHGDMQGSHGLFNKTCPYEEAIRVPLIISGGASDEGKRGINHDPISLIDLAPTTLGLCGLAIPDWLHGTDYSFLWRPEREPPSLPDSAYLQCVSVSGVFDSTDRPYRGIITTDNWKYVCLEGQPWQLFNLSEDPYEQVNHALNPRYRAIRDKLQQRLAAWISDTGDDFTLPDG